MNLTKFFEQVYNLSHLKEMTSDSFISLLRTAIETNTKNNVLDGNSLCDFLKRKNKLFVTGIKNASDPNYKGAIQDNLAFKDENGAETVGVIGNNGDKNEKIVKDFAKNVDKAEVKKIIDDYKDVDVKDFFGIEKVDQHFIGKCFTEIIKSAGQINVTD